ncbi:YnfA family protein [Leptospira sp. id769339]|uniref:YnfA family protein n=1 Tax=Leptospira sp. id769339 TaxID=2864221 RepID=UPI00214B5314|nr:YnfA family protein [Leptospira sp. id769339]
MFILAGLCEIGGGFLILSLYGLVATWQPANFARTYATYSGVFIVMSLVWAWKFDNFIPNKFDLIGSSIALIGVIIIFFAPR